MNIKTVYLAGPMRKYKHRYYNFPAFDAYTQNLREAGLVVNSPAEMDRQYGFDPEVSMTCNLPTPEECALRDIEAVIASDAVMLMPEWEDSRGSIMEVAVANFLDKP